MLGKFGEVNALAVANLLILQDVVGNLRLLDLVSNEPRLQSTVLQTVGSKGYDGFLIAVVH